MKNIPFFNSAPNCLMNCAIMALMYFQPWASVDDLGRTWDNPFSQKDWMRQFKQKLGFGPNFNGKSRIGLEMRVCAQFLNEMDLSADPFNRFNLGYKDVRLYMDAVDWYSQAPFILIASVQYNYLPNGRYAPHAVVIVGVTDDEVCYHDPGMHEGAYQRCSRDQFRTAMRMRVSASSNLMAIWDHDNVPDIHEALKDGPCRKIRSPREKTFHSEKSSFTIYKDPVQLLRKLIQK